MATVRIDLDSAGIRQALVSREMRAAVNSVGESIASRARSQTDDPIEVADGGRSRARTYIHRLGSGAAGEADDRALGRSVGGA